MEPAVEPAIIDQLPRPLTRIEHVAFETWKCTGIVPYKYQVDFALALDSGKDVLCVAGTGSGKSLAFVMVLFIRTDTIIWIVSPLNVIENQMAENYRRYGLSAVSVNASTINPQLIKVRFPRIHCHILTTTYRTSKLANTMSLYHPPKRTRMLTSSGNALFLTTLPTSATVQSPTKLTVL
jgi:superfamily II DNA or RNA helicase